MVLEVATVLLGVCVGAIAVLYAAPRGYLGHPRKKESGAAVEPVVMTFAQTEEQVVPPAETFTTAAEPEPAPSPPPALYENVQPEVTPVPVTYTPSSAISFGASVSRKPTRTYRRRAAPVRSAASRTPRSTRPKKR
jgi:hypothetical protein